MANNRLVKHATTGDVYEVAYVVRNVDAMFACYKLSAYDGMPIGELVHIPASNIVEADAKRIAWLAVGGALPIRESI